MRLIDADKLMSDIEHYHLSDGKFQHWVEIQPTIEPQPRKKGKWIEQDAGGDGVFYECSVCKDAFTLIDGTPSDNNYNFCPNCGSYNGGEEE